VDLATGKAASKTPEGLSCGAISPDSRSFVGRLPSGSISLYPFDGSAPRPVVNENKRFIPAQWSDDGVFLFGYHTGEIPAKVYKKEIATGKETFLQELKPGVPAGVVLVAPIVISRDGKRFAYSYNQTLSTLYLISGLH
jgi:hypothetical protein